MKTGFLSIRRVKLVSPFRLEIGIPCESLIEMSDNCLSLSNLNYMTEASYFKGDVQELVHSMTVVARYARDIGNVETCCQILEDLKAFARYGPIKSDLDESAIDEALTEIGNIYVYLTNDPEKEEIQEDVDYDYFMCLNE